MRPAAAVVASATRCGRGAAALLALCACTAAGCGRAGESDAYVPELGEIMSATQMRHLKLWYAGEARNWTLTAYEIDELEEGFADAARFHPVHKDSPRPLSELIPDLTRGPIAALRASVSREDPQAFAAAYDALTEACNACHAASRFSFNVVTRPTRNPYSNQRFEPAP